MARHYIYDLSVNKPTSKTREDLYDRLAKIRLIEIAQVDNFSNKSLLTFFTIFWLLVM
jgi:hypothetical protein